MSKRSSRSEPPLGPPNLLVSRAEASEKIKAQIGKGQELRTGEIHSDSELESAETQGYRWSSYTTELLKRIFDNSSIANEYNFFGIAVGYMNEPLPKRIKRFREYVNERIHRLESIYDRFELHPFD